MRLVAIPVEAAETVEMFDLGGWLPATFVAHVEHHRTLGSTNARAKQLAAEGPQALPLLIVADAQTAGRGRGGNRWWTGRGSLAMSLLVDLDQLEIPTAARSLLALGTAVAVVDAAAPLVPGHRLGIRWPNDVEAAGRKLAGILVETLAGGLSVVGIGLNTNNTLAEAPPELKQTATTIFELTGRRHDHAAVLAALLAKLAETFAQLANNAEETARRANALCTQHGRMLSIQSGSQTFTGRCAGIAADGALLLETPEGLRSVYSGVVLAPE